MKVVLFCGGQGMRIREYSDNVPKPMVPIGYRPILWHVMKYYAHYGHKDFILCLGYKADVVKSYFRSYDETVSSITDVLGTRYRPPRPKAVEPTTQPSETMPATGPDDTTATAPTSTQPAGDVGGDTAAADESDDHLLPPLTEAEIRDIVRQEVLDQLTAHDAAADGAGVLPEVIIGIQGGNAGDVVGLQLAIQCVAASERYREHHSALRGHPAAAVGQELRFAQGGVAKAGEVPDLVDCHRLKVEP